MDKNYQIIEGINIVFENRQYDLHNDFDFKYLTYSVYDRKLVLNWCSTNADMPENISIEFTTVSEFKFMPRDSEIPFSEDDCISCFGYWVEEDWANGVILVEPNQTIEPHWATAIAFMSGAILLVKAEESKVKIIEN